MSVALQKPISWEIRLRTIIVGAGFVTFLAKKFGYTALSEEQILMLGGVLGFVYDAVIVWIKRRVKAAAKAA